jgi:hypothetical protein
MLMLLNSSENTVSNRSKPAITKNIVQQVMSAGGELHGQPNANKKHPNANTMLTESLR